MPKICYKTKRFSPVALDAIAKINRVVADMQRQGFVITLRQLYYQFVANDLFPDSMKWKNVGNNKWVRDENGTKNAEPNYKWIGDVLSDGRMAGLIDWNAIEDRTRVLKQQSHWDGPKDIIDVVAKQFRIDKWADQPFIVEVWVEKDALVNIVETAARRQDVSYFSCRGYTSQSALWEAGQRLLGYMDSGKTPIILHLGDHDPSGKDMTRDIMDRLEVFCGGPVEVRRLALNMDQIDQYSPPPNPTKITDSRAKKYIDEFGMECWELDALRPAVLMQIIEDEIDQIRDIDLWDAKVEEETKHRDLLGKCSKRWTDVVTMLEQ